MSIVGPRPEQVGICRRNAANQIPYYDEQSYCSKPGLTGWAQLHVYAATLEETQRKLQYDCINIKHPQLMLILKSSLNRVQYFYF